MGVVAKSTFSEAKNDLYSFGELILEIANLVKNGTALVRLFLAPVNEEK